MVREVLIREVCRTGVQTVERDGERYFVTIKNRTYQSEHEIPIEAARRFYRAMKGRTPSARTPSALRPSRRVDGRCDPALQQVVGDGSGSSYAP